MHQPTLVKWADLIGPLFPSDARVALFPQLNQIAISWMPPAGSDQPGARGRTVAVHIAPNAIKDYRNAQDGQQARADRKLFAFVHSSLKRYRPDDESDGPLPEFRIVVASVDILSR